MSVCTPLPWDSEFFGFSIARFVSNRVDASDLTSALTASYDCIYLMADPADLVTASTVARAEFLLTDVRLHLSTTASGSGLSPVRPGGRAETEETGPDNEIEYAVPSDIEDLEAIAGSAHRDSRFYYDPGFADADCDRFYRLWIAKSCNGYADQVVVIRDHARAVGYVTCHLDAEGSGHIGLVGIAATARGQGMGTRLISHALIWFGRQGVGHVTVVTQGRNIQAQRVYQKCGFRSERLELIYHCWPKRRSTS